MSIAPPQVWLQFFDDNVRGVSVYVPEWHDNTPITFRLEKIKANGTRYVRAEQNEQPRPEQAGGEASAHNVIEHTHIRICTRCRRAEPELDVPCVPLPLDQQIETVPCQRCEGIATTTVTTRHFGPEKLCGPCAANVRRDGQEVVEHAPAAPEQPVSWTSVNMTEEPRDPRFTIEEGDKLLATVYDAATAARIITEHNEHSTLVAQRERLLATLREIVTEVEFVGDAKAPFTTWIAEKIRPVLTTIEQEGTQDAYTK